ncbi:winged helix-turn-helix transcriptional regulator [Candidatus Pacearchaeota archaeon]|nr:winged helix-turn-helix transcriptional regulator [Candidatus Pacearchaeota archaeon]MBD3283477.1 winged helix-turn-helix transcriptional regulator [Candidatus Pacearchaeota archaeon]
MNWIIFMEKINEVLGNLGFENREIKIYLILIEEGDLTALQLSKKAEIDRTTVYDILERMMNKGIVSCYIKNKTKNFRALNAGELLDFFREKYNSLKNIIPELNKITKRTREEVKCELFQGKEGVRTVVKDIIQNTKNYYKAIGIRQEYIDVIGYLNDHAKIKFADLKIKEIGIVEEKLKFSKLKHGSYKYLGKKFLSSITTVIYNDKVLYIFWKQPYFAIRIQNKDFARLQEEYFNLLWKIAKT